MQNFVAYDEKLASRLRTLFEGRPDVVEKRMFGGLCFLLNGNMWVGMVDQDLMLRVGTPKQWLARAESFVASLPPREAASKKLPRPRALPLGRPRGERLPDSRP